MGIFRFILLGDHSVTIVVFNKYIVYKCVFKSNVNNREIIINRKHVHSLLELLQHPIDVRTKNYSIKYIAAFLLSIIEFKTVKVLFT